MGDVFSRPTLLGIVLSFTSQDTNVGAGKGLCVWFQMQNSGVHCADQSQQAPGPQAGRLITPCLRFSMSEVDTVIVPAFQASCQESMRQWSHGASWRHRKVPAHTPAKSWGLSSANGCLKTQNGITG